jgi:murein DD-endopeptidase MepM/ murein hydrolase activator NlpD
MDDKHKATYGGFLEDRATLWSCFYNAKKEKKRLYHLGIDFNNLVPGEPVSSLTGGQIVHMLKDNDKLNGWGGRVMVFDPIRKIYTMYGHLDPNTLPKAIGPIQKGQIIGHIGNPIHNGGWFPHLHLQCMTKEYVESFSDWNLIDGYETDIVKIQAGVLDRINIFYTPKICNQASRVIEVVVRSCLP